MEKVFRCLVDYKDPEDYENYVNDGSYEDCFIDNGDQDDCYVSHRNNFTKKEDCPHWREYVKKFKTDETEYPTCPYCGQKYDLPFDKEISSINCKKCNIPFEIIINITYTTRKIDV
jgi:hypothetical protein